MNNPYSQHPQHYGNQRSGRNRNERWDSDDYRSARPSWREDNSQRTRNRSAWGESSDLAQSRYSPNYSPTYDQREGYDQEWQNRGGEDYGYYGSEMHGQRDVQPWSLNDPHETYSGEDFGQQDYSFGSPLRHQFDRDERSRWQQGSRGSQNRSFTDSGNFGYRQSSNAPWERQHSGQFGSDYDRGDNLQRGAYGLQKENHRGKGPKGYMRTDERIREEICECLSDDPHIDASEISVEVRGGVVTLDGSVSDRQQKFRAEDISDNCSGVKDVHNGLRVTNQSRGSQSAAGLSGSTLGTTGTAAGGSSISAEQYGGSQQSSKVTKQ